MVTVVDRNLISPTVTLEYTGRPMRSTAVTSSGNVAVVVAIAAMLVLPSCAVIVGGAGVGHSIGGLVESKRGNAPSSTCPRVAAAIGAVVDLSLASYIVYDANKDGIATGHYVAAGLLGADAILGVYLTQLFCEERRGG